MSRPPRSRQTAFVAGEMDLGRAAPRARRAPAVIGVLVLVGGVVAVVHWPVLAAQGLALDDHQYIVDNALVQNPSWSSVGRCFCEVLRPSTVAGYYQPLSMVSLMADYGLGGRADNLRPFHRTSLALHIANTLLLVGLLHLLIGNVWSAALVGLLFGVHPMTVEPTAWVADRKTLLATFFALASLIAYVGYVRRAAWWCYGVCAVLFGLALLAKPTCTPLPIAMLLLDYWPLRRLSWRTALEKTPLLVLAGLAGLVTVVSQGRAAGLTGGTGYDPLRIVLTICHNLVFYLRHMAWPVSLSWHYPFPEPFDASQPMVRAGLVGTPLLVAALLVSWRRTRAALVGGLVFFVLICPTLGVIGFTYVIAGDKFAYLPAVGLLLPLAVGARWLVRRRYGLMIGIGLTVALAAGEARATREYLAHWRDTEELHRYALAQCPQAYAVRYNLGQFLQEGGRLDEAQAELERVLGQRPDHWRARSALGLVLHTRGRPDDAIAQLEEAVRLNPNEFPAQYNLGVFLAELGRTDEAIAHYRVAGGLRPTDFRVYTNLGNALAGQRRYEEALAQYEAALRLRPNYARGHYNRGTMLRALDRTEEARADFRRALEVDPDHVGARQQLEALTAPGQ